MSRAARSLARGEKSDAAHAEEEARRKERQAKFDAESSENSNSEESANASEEEEEEPLSTRRGRRTTQTQQSHANQEGLHAVERILGERRVNGKLQYQIRWEGYTKTSWEEAKNLTHCKEALQEWKKKQQQQQSQHPSTPAPSTATKPTRRSRSASKDESNDEEETPTAPTPRSSARRKTARQSSPGEKDIPSREVSPPITQASSTVKGKKSNVPPTPAASVNTSTPIMQPHIPLLPLPAVPAAAVPAIVAAAPSPVLLPTTSITAGKSGKHIPPPSPSITAATIVASSPSSSSSSKPATTVTGTSSRGRPRKKTQLMNPEDDDTEPGASVQPTKAHAFSSAIAALPATSMDSGEEGSLSDQQSQARAYQQQLLHHHHLATLLAQQHLMAVTAQAQAQQAQQQAQQQQQQHQAQRSLQADQQSSSLQSSPSPAVTSATPPQSFHQTQSSLQAPTPTSAASTSAGVSTFNFSSSTDNSSNRDSLPPLEQKDERMEQPGEAGRFGYESAEASKDHTPNRTGDKDRLLSSLHSSSLPPVSFDEIELKEDSYAMYWTASAAQQQVLQEALEAEEKKQQQQRQKEQEGRASGKKGKEKGERKSSPAAASTAVENGTAASTTLHIPSTLTLPPHAASSAPLTGVSPCKIAMVNPLYDPLDQLAPLSGGGIAAAVVVGGSTVPSSTDDPSTSDLLPLHWATQEQQTWEWSKLSAAEWAAGAITLPTTSGNIDEDTNMQTGDDDAGSGTDRQPEGEQKDHAKDASDILLDESLIHPTITLNGTVFTCAPESLPTVPRPPRAPSTLLDEPTMEMTANALVAPMDGLPPTPGPSLPSSPAPTPPMSNAASPTGPPSQPTTLGKRKSMTLSPPLSAMAGGGSGSRRGTPSGAHTPGSSHSLPVRRSNDAEVMAASGVNVNVNAPRMTRAEEAAALASGKKGVAPPTPASAATNTTTPRTSRHQTPTSAPANPRRSNSPYSLSFGTADGLDQEEHAEEARLLRRKGHLSHADNLRLKELAKKHPVGPAAITPSPSPLPLPHPKTGSSSSNSTPEPSVSVSVSVKPLNRKERRSQARADGTLKTRVEPPTALQVVDEEPASGESPLKKAKIVTVGTPSKTSPFPALIPHAPNDLTTAPTPTRSSRSQLDLTNVLMSPKDWPNRHGKKSAMMAGDETPTTPAGSRTKVATPTTAGNKRKLDASSDDAPVSTPTSTRRASASGNTPKPPTVIDADGDENMDDPFAGHDPLDGSNDQQLEDDEADSSEPASKSKKQKMDPLTGQSTNKPLYGNYDRYYQYRNGLPWQDDRFHFFEPRWFSGKSVLDLGCNAGLLTVLLASSQGFNAKKVTGIDLDERLIKQAREKVQQRVNWLTKEHEKTRKSGGVMSPAAAASSSSAASSVPASGTGWLPVSSLSRFTSGSSSKKMSLGGAGSSVALSSPQSLQSNSINPLLQSFPANISFEVGEVLTCPWPQADIILVMSLTKWIHFHHGDKGIIDLFAKIQKTLPKGGLVILEPQPFRTYKKKASWNETMKSNFKKIQLKPEDFSSYVTKTYGWILKHTFHHEKSSPDGQSAPVEKGFNIRPIYVFEKK